MNIFIMIMLIFALIGFIDKMFSLKWGLSETFDKGLLTMGSLSVSIIGIYCIGMTFVQNHIDFISQLNDILFFDSSVLIGSLLAPDMGGYPIVSQMTSNVGMIVFSGVLLSSTLGCTISFQLPIFLSFLEEKEIDTLMKGFIIGIITIPVGMLFSYPFLDMELSVFLINLLPIFIICIIAAVLIITLPKYTVKILSIFANVIKALSYFLFLLVILGLYIPSLQYAPLSLVQESTLMVLKMIVVICGSMVLSEIILKYGSKYIQYIADKLSVNKESVIGFILNCASSLAMLPLYSKMNKKGKLMNAAFSVSGAYVFGGQLGFIAGVSNDSVTVYVLIKLLCGILAVLLINIIYKDVEEEYD